MKVVTFVIVMLLCTGVTGVAGLVLGFGLWKTILIAAAVSGAMQVCYVGWIVILARQPSRRRSANRDRMHANGPARLATNHSRD